MDRSVKNLPTIELYRKRANDRDNQRICRARKKVKIEELQSEIVELNARLSSAHEEIAVLKRNEDRLVTALSNAAQNLQRVLQNSSADPLLSTLPKNAANDSPSVEPPRTSGLGSILTEPELLQRRSTNHNCSDDGQTSSLPGSIAEEHFEQTLPVCNIAPPDTSHSVVFDFAGPANHNIPVNFTQSSDFQQQPEPLSISLSDVMASIPPSDPLFQPAIDQTGNLLPAWSAMPLHINPTTALDTAFWNFICNARTSSGVQDSLDELTASNFPSIGSLLNPESDGAARPISSCIGNHARINLKVPDLPDRIAVMYHMSTLLRWLAFPSPETFAALPGHLIPTRAQTTVPHPIWIDMIMWPEARDRFIHDVSWSDFDLIRDISARCLKCHWPHGSSGLFEGMPGGKAKLSQAFEKHIRDIQNWSMTVEIEETFPVLKNTMRIRA